MPFGDDSKWESPHPQLRARREADEPEAKCNGQAFDTTVDFTLAELLMLDFHDLLKLFEERVGTDEMGGLDIKIIEIVDDETIRLSVKGTVDEWASAELNKVLPVLDAAAARR